MAKSITKPVVVIPNLNGGEALLDALGSLHRQTLAAHIIVVDNGSTDASAHTAHEKYQDIEYIWHQENKGYAGGVNPGFRRALELGAKYVAPFNDDAVADPHWLEHLVAFLENHPDYGAACAKVLKSDQKTIDSTGDYLTHWGLPYPRGRNEPNNGQYDAQTEIFAASGAASLYRTQALQEVGLLDERFFAYYEDVDLSFRLQNRGWKVGFVPQSIVYHKIGMTSGRMKGFTTYQTLKNLPLLLYKNLPVRYWMTVFPRFWLAYALFFFRAISRMHVWPALRGAFMAGWLSLVMTPEVIRLHRARTVKPEYIWSLFVHDLPPNAHALRALRRRFHRLIK